MRKILTLLLALVATIILLVRPASAQIVFGQPTSWSIAPVFTSWDFGDSSLTQFQLPVSGFIPLQDNLEALFFVDHLSHSLNDGSRDVALNGLGDARIQLNRSLADDRVLLSLGLRVPTGKTSLSTDEGLPIMEVLSQDYLTYPRRRLGEGLGLSLMIGGATQAGSMRLGATALYLLTGSYTPYENDDDYNPGDVIQLVGTADLPTGDWLWTGSLGYTASTTDQANDEDIFKQSPQVDVSLSFARVADEGMGASGYIRYISRGDNELFDIDTTATDSATIIDVIALQLYGSEFSIGGSVSFALSEGWSLAPSLSYRSISANDVEELEILSSNGASIVGIGGDLGYQPAASSIGYHLGLTYYTGDADDGNLDLSGFQIRFGLGVTL